MPDVDAGLLGRWLAARSVARQLPAPVPDHDGYRVDTRSEVETCRYVFAEINWGLIALSRQIDDPLTLLKVCATAETMAGALPPNWQVEPTGSVMSCDCPDLSPATPAGYVIELYEAGGVIRGAVRTNARAHAASGYAVERGGVFIFDRIVVEQAHQRRGLGAALMTALTRCRRDQASRFTLVATPAGRSLYEKLGWSARSAYSTARLRNA